MASVTEVGERALDKLRPPKGQKCPPEILERLKRGREGLEEVAARRKEGLAFAEGNHYVSIDKTGKKLVQQSTVPISQRGDKPNHRVRISHDILSPVLHGKTSAATQRIPGYEVVPTTSDPEDYSASRIAKNVALAGYEIWGLKEVFRHGVYDALVTEEAFFMAEWDSNRGPFIEVEDVDENDQPTGEKRVIGMGEVQVNVYSGLQVIWEPGVDFADSRWYAIEHTKPVEVVEAEEGFIGGKLTANATTNPIIGQTETKGAKSLIVTDYFERPCRQYPDGRRLTLGDGRELFPEDRYPLRDHEDKVVDAPCLHRLYYSVGGESERARGLVQALVETVRQFDYSSNKAAEYLQLVLTPQMVAPEGAVKGVITDEPGAIIELDPQFDAREIKWRDMPAMPREFDNERDRAMRQLGFIANDNPIPARVESGKAIESLAQKDILAWEDFIEDLAKVHAAVMRDCLTLVQRYYSEQRMIKFRGRTGWEAIADFQGADIHGQTDVRVRPGSLEPLTQAAIEQKIINLNNMLPPGLIPPEVLMSALVSGNIDKLNDFYEEDEAQANWVIGQIRAGTLFEVPDRRVFPGEEAPAIDPESGAIAAWVEEPQWEIEPQRDENQNPIPGTGKLVPGTGRPAMQEMVPGWMPRPFDGVPVIKHRIESFMKSDEWRSLDSAAQEATAVYYDALLRLEAQKAARAADIQNQEAARLGLENAAGPQAPKGRPSPPALEPGSE